MNAQETTRLVLGLKDKGLSDEEITNIMLYMESGDQKYIQNIQTNK